MRLSTFIAASTFALIVPACADPSNDEESDLAAQAETVALPNTSETLHAQREAFAQAHVGAKVTFAQDIRFGETKTGWPAIASGKVTCALDYRGNDTTHARVQQAGTSLLVTDITHGVVVSFPTDTTVIGVDLAEVAPASRNCALGEAVMVGGAPHCPADVRLTCRVPPPVGGVANAIASALASSTIIKIESK